MDSMSDRELLELAAKAAGIKLQRSRLDDPLWKNFLLVDRDPQHPGQGKGWNPLTDDGDALRLAMTLGLQIAPDPANGMVCAWLAHEEDAEPIDGTTAIELWSDSGGDKFAATRLAIVRAAASIGKEMK